MTCYPMDIRCWGAVGPSYCGKATPYDPRTSNFGVAFDALVTLTQG